MMDKAYCEKCQMEVDDLERHNQEVHGDEGDMNGDMPDDDENM
jgi:hypothetical protein